MSHSELQTDPYSDSVYERNDDPPAEALGYEPSTVGIERHTSNEGGNDAVMYGDGDDEWYMIDALKLRNVEYYR